MRTPSAPVTPSFDGPTAAAETAVRTFEALAPGERYAEQAALASAAVAELYGQAAETVCPSTVLPPVTAESLQDFEAFTASMTPAGVAAELVNLHALAVAGRHVGLAVAIRGPRGRKIVSEYAAAAAAQQGLRGVEAKAHIDREIRRFVDGLAAQLREAEPAAAAVLLDLLPDLENRITACAERHAEHVRAELARAEAERCAAAEAVERAEAQTRAEIAAYFASRHSHAFIVKGEALSGQALAAIAQRRGVRSGSGEFITLSLDELSNAYRRALAADAAAVEGIAS